MRIGERLSPEIVNQSISDYIGKYKRNNAISSINEITSNLDPIQNNNNSVDFILPQGEVKFIGDCLGTSDSTQIYIDDIQQLNLTINVNDKQTTLSFKSIKLRNQNYI
ncbi:hypothetical protein ACTFIU_010876 [Dictyostelium citrinum]